MPQLVPVIIGLMLDHPEIDWGPAFYLVVDGPDDVAIFIHLEANMPVRPRPLEFRCPQCGWRQVWQPASDALTTDDLPPAHCPRCKHADLEVRPSSGASTLWGRLRQRLRQV